MHYFFANLIGFAIWLPLFLYRKDLRKPMLIVGLISAPLAFLDLLFVPHYWVPKTFLDLPIGIEGFIYTFQFAGVCTAFYETVCKKQFEKIANYKVPAKEIIIFVVASLILLGASKFFTFNTALSIYMASIVGLILMINKRKDLKKPALYGGILYGLLYFVSLSLWFHIFKDTNSWFTLDYLPKIFILKVPLYEIIFGILQGAFWGNMYEFVFGFRHKPYNN